MKVRNLIIHTMTRALVSTVAAVTVVLMTTSAFAIVVCDNVPLGVVDGCKAASRTKVLIHDDPDSTKAVKDKLKWSWLKGDTVSTFELGNPVSGGAEYALCIYDGSSGSHVLVRDLQVPTGPIYWRVKGQDGYEYKDLLRANDGLLKIRLKSSPSVVGKAQVKLQARGAELQPPGPYVPLIYFEMNPSVVFNFVSSDGTCWTSEYLPLPDGDIRKNNTGDFRAQTRD